METQVWVNHTKFRFEFEFGNDPICIYIQNECIKNKKKIFCLLKISFSLVWSVWHACGNADFLVFFIEICNSPLLNTFYLAWTVVFLEEYTEK